MNWKTHCQRNSYWHTRSVLEWSSNSDYSAIYGIFLGCRILLAHKEDACTVYALLRASYCFMPSNWSVLLQTSRVWYLRWHNTTSNYLYLNWRHKTHIWNFRHFNSPLSLTVTASLFVRTFGRFNQSVHWLAKLYKVTWFTTSCMSHFEEWNNTSGEIRWKSTWTQASSK